MTPDFSLLADRARNDSRTISSGEIRWLVGEVERLRKFERAMESLAAQIICPKQTATEMAEQILRVKP
jgi:hypothetical protein